MQHNLVYFHWAFVRSKVPISIPLWNELQNFICMQETSKI